MKEEDEIIIHTNQWIEQFIIGYTICPFAEWPWQQNKIWMRTEDAATPESMIYALATYLKYLSLEVENFSNAFLIFPYLPFDFSYFYNMVEESYHLLAELEIEERFQLIAFHPDFTFAGANPDERGNYVNRSPYPMVHILQIEELSEAIEKHGNTMKIPFRNQQYLEEMDDTAFAHIAKMVEGKWRQFQ